LIEKLKNAVKIGFKDNIDDNIAKPSHVLDGKDFN